MRRLFLRLARGTGSWTLFILALLEKLQLPAQDQYFLLLAGQGVVEFAHRVLLVGQLGLHLDQLLFYVIDIRQTDSPEYLLIPFGQQVNILPARQKDTARS